MTTPTRWRPDGHTVLDDKTGASLDCAAPSIVKPELRDSWSTALAHSVAAKLNDTDRPRRDWTRARRAAGHAAWVSCVAVVAVAMVVPQLAAALSLLGVGAIVGTMVTSACSRSWRRNAEAKAARTDAATEHALRVVVDAQRTEDEVAAQAVPAKL